MYMPTVSMNAYASVYIRIPVMMTSSAIKQSNALHIAPKKLSLHYFRDE